MASNYIQAGSPLDDYFRDEVSNTLEAITESTAEQRVAALGDTTLVDDLCDLKRSAWSDGGSEKGWTGVIPNESSSSRSSSLFSHRQKADQYPHANDLSPIKTQPAEVEEMDAFAERFKYLICTSGVMDKDYVPCLGGAPRPREDVNAGVERLDSGESMETGGGVDKPVEGDWRTLGRNQGFLWWRKARDRPDILLAGLVLVIATDWVVGWKMLLALVAVVATVGVGIGILAVQTTPPNRKLSLRSVPSVVTSVNSVTRVEPHSELLQSLQQLLDSSSSLDSTIDSALSLLQSQPSADSHPDLRLAVHRLADNMTDHLATATSTLLGMVDRKELAVLSEMYDITIGPNANNNTRARADTDVSEVDSHQSIQSIKRLSWNPSKPLIPLSLPMGTSASSPARLKGDRGHTVHMSLGGMPLEDRFTTLPKRKPRASKRSSWAHEWTEQIAHDFLSDTLSSTKEPESVEQQHSSSDESRSTDLPRTPDPRRRLITLRRSSPLSRRDSDANPNSMPQRHIFPIVPPTPAKEMLLPSPFPKSPIGQDHKRRSLQSMPYFHSDRSDITSPGRASISGSSDMARGGSLQVSDLQVLRDQSTNGTPLQHRVIEYGGGALLSPTKSLLMPERPKVIRAESLSPLTLPGLKAACLGVHMKRRKMGTCLLGLRFEVDDEYWTEVRRVLAVLVDSIDGEAGALRAVQQQLAASELPSAIGGSRKAQDTEHPPWERLGAQVGSGQNLDFAPRTSDEAMLLQQVDIMQEALHRTWIDLQAMRLILNEFPADALLSPWTALRGNLGDLLRQWERGKESISRMDSSQRTHEPLDDREVADPGSGPQPLPPFMKSWEDDHGLSSIATDSVRSTSDDTHDIKSSPHQDTLEHGRFEEVLPPPGQDMVFESLPLPPGVKVERSKLSREERIKLMKEARESGQLIAQESKRGPVELSGDVVGELKSMIGLIRKRKGIEESEPAPRASEILFDNPPTRTPRNDLPPGLADELKRAFIFPTAHSAGVGSQENR